MESKEISAQAYIRVGKNEPFTFPSDAYVKACCKTIYLSKKLKANGAEISNTIDLEVVNGTTHEVHSVKSLTLT